MTVGGQRLPQDALSSAALRCPYRVELGLGWRGLSAGLRALEVVVVRQGQVCGLGGIAIVPALLILLIASRANSHDIVQQFQIASELIRIQRRLLLTVGWIGWIAHPEPLSPLLPSEEPFLQAGPHTSLSTHGQSLQALLPCHRRPHVVKGGMIALDQSWHFRQHRRYLAAHC